MTLNELINHRTGRLKSEREVQKVLAGLKHPMFMPACSFSGTNYENVISLLYNNVSTLMGEFPTLVQEGPDCTTFATSHCVSTLGATEIVIKGDFEEWLGMISTEDIYGGSRVNIGKGQLGNGGGSYGGWVARYVHEIGTLLRKKYGNTDLSVYNWNLAERWGRTGVPADLVEVAREHPVKTISLVKTYEEVRAALANGYPVNVCSSQGFTNKRDKEGFASPSGTWPHSMAILGVDDKGEGCSRRRPGVLIVNSWGTEWISGPLRHNQPLGSFWVDADVLEERMLSDEDSWAFSDFDGYPAKELNLRWA